MTFVVAKSRVSPTTVAKIAEQNRLADLAGGRFLIFPKFQIFSTSVKNVN